MNRILPIMMLKSIGLAAANANVSSSVLEPWIGEIEQYVAKNGKFNKDQVGYLPLAPPLLLPSLDFSRARCRIYLMRRLRPSF